MAKVLGTEYIGGRYRRWLQHTDDYGKTVMTAQTMGDAQKLVDHVAANRDSPNVPGVGRKIATIDKTEFENVCRLKAHEWNIRPHQAYDEIFGGKTDRGQRVWNLFLHDSNYRKLQYR